MGAQFSSTFDHTEPLFTNKDTLPAHLQRMVGKIAEDAIGMCVFLGAGSSIFPPILQV